MATGPHERITELGRKAGFAGESFSKNPYDGQSLASRGFRTHWFDGYKVGVAQLAAELAALRAAAREVVASERDTHVSFGSATSPAHERYNAALAKLAGMVALEAHDAR